MYLIYKLKNDGHYHTVESVPDGVMNERLEVALIFLGHLKTSQVLSKK